MNAGIEEGIAEFEIEGEVGLLVDRVGRKGTEGELERLLDSPASSFRSEGLLFSFTGPFVA